ncbi:MAG: 2-oxoglutarate ferredoxin oxidoreductase subunit gamma [Bacteroidota bacterium]|nr:2-oxoglutarate ferredoxin oxidoreductase subunit gamma [Bacteroidota bacterium]
MNIRFSGFGGQGIILAGVIFGWGAVLDGKNVIQTQSYGSSARGGACKCDVIMDNKQIYELEPHQLDILVSFSQPAYDSFKKFLKPDGVQFLDSDLVPNYSDLEKTFNIPATDIAFKEWNNKIIGNIIMLGCITQAAGLVGQDSMEESIKKFVPGKYYQINIEAFRKGISLIREFAN